MGRTGQFLFLVCSMLWIATEFLLRVLGLGRNETAISSLASTLSVIGTLLIAVGIMVSAILSNQRKITEKLGIEEPKKDPPA